jgi:hypothetical protein
MPKKALPKNENEVQEVLPPEPAKKSGANKCSHINRHYYNTDGKLEELACVLADGHEGDHSAPAKRNEGDRVEDEKGRLVKVNYRQVDTTAYWNDMASKPTIEIVEGVSEQMNMMQKDLVMEIMKKNQNITVGQAIRMAKRNEVWNLSLEPG